VLLEPDSALEPIQMGLGSEESISENHVFPLLALFALPMKISIFSIRVSLFLSVSGSIALMQSSPAGSFQFQPIGSLITAREGHTATIPRSELSSPSAGHTATLLPNGKVLIAGGVNYSATLASAELFERVPAESGDAP
jgi:hypothetical protein